MTPADPLLRFGRAVGAAFDRYVTPALLGLGLAIASSALLY